MNNYCGGFYQVGNQNFANKIMALIESTRTKLPITWNFHDDVWDKVSIRLAEKLDMRTLFCERAKQLREKYDYLALYYSGGSDSWTVLDSFIRAGVMVDELIVNWPVKATRGVGAIFSYKPNFTDLHPSNTLSEWDNFLEEDLKDIKNRFPKVIITISDWSESAANRLTEDSLMKTNSNFLISAQQIISGNFRSDSEIKASDFGLKTAYIYGTDRPSLYRNKRICYMYFDDRHTRVNVSLESFGSTVEYFYWTPDMPMLQISQARTVFNAFANKLLPISIFINNASNREAIIKFQNAVRRVTRPDYDFSRFQAGFTSASLFNDRLAWCNNIPEYRNAFQYWRDTVYSHLNLIDKKYLIFTKDGLIDGIKPLKSKLYPIGIFRTDID